MNIKIGLKLYLSYLFYHLLYLFKNINYREYNIICTTLTMVDTNGRAVVTGGAPPDFGVLEKRTEREIDSLLLSAPSDLKN